MITESPAFDLTGVSPGFTLAGVYFVPSVRGLPLNLRAVTLWPILMRGRCSDFVFWFACPNCRKSDYT